MSTPVLVVRVADDDDIDAVLRVHAAHDPAARSGVTSDRDAATWERMRRTPDLSVYLAELDGAPVGTASLIVMPNLIRDCAPTAFIEAVLVVPEQRRRGIATAILRRVIENADAAMCDKVQLLSHKRHAVDGGHALYERAGFSAEAEGFRLCLRGAPPIA
jgi:GNAT superfamily N-acetyltransferase